ncbi:hypothetical protein [Nonomuraea sp. NPDC050783]|uniref:hypothetical protein n=1 Tax=Nonomuraea sp. NPDC050783 TaxID=3154634 RepID=UPI003465A8A9
MARDENDRPYEDGQARSLNPELTGDVLSPRWSNDDTDEQPAVQVSGNETYILPPEPGGDVLGGTPQAGPYDELAPSGEALEEESPYLPLDRGYEGEHDDRPALAGSGHDGAGQGDGPDDGGHGGGGDDGHGGGPGGPGGYDSYDSYGDDDRPRRGFLGSGWTDDSGDGHSGRAEREVRRRTRTLVLAAVAVVLVGVGAGFLLTGTSSDDPCAGGRCASAGEVRAPSESALPEETPQEEDEQPTAEPTEPATTEPGEPGTARSTPSPERARPTREPAARPTRTREEEPSARSSARPSRSQEPEARETDDDPPASVRDSQTERKEQAETEQPTEAPSATEAPDPAPTQEERKGLLDFLFPWA